MKARYKIEVLEDGLGVCVEMTQGDVLRHEDVTLVMLSKTKHLGKQRMDHVTMKRSLALQPRFFASLRMTRCVRMTRYARMTYFHEWQEGDIYECDRIARDAV